MMRLRCALVSSYHPEYEFDSLVPKAPPHPNEPEEGKRCCERTKETEAQRHPREEADSSGIVTSVAFVQNCPGSHSANRRLPVSLAQEGSHALVTKIKGVLQSLQDGVELR
jgi:hypothetical protein